MMKRLRCMRRWAIAAGLGLASTGTALGQLPYEVVARTQQATGTGQIWAFDLKAPSINESGVVAFSGMTNAQKKGVWVSTPGSAGRTTSLVALDGQAAPGTTGTFDGLFDVSLNDGGKVAFGGTAAGGLGIWSNTSGALSAIAYRGLIAPDGKPWSGPVTPSLNNTGKIAFVGTTAVSASFNNGGVWSNATSPLASVARGFQNAPGGGLYDGGFYEPTLNDAGKLAFVATTTTNAVGLWSNVSGTLSQVVRSNQASPDGGLWTSFGSPVLNNAGQLAFQGSTSGGQFGNGTGIWKASDSGAIELVAHAGQAAVGGGTWSQLDSATLNGGGQVAFRGKTATNTGIFATDAFGQLIEVVRTGQSMAFGAGLVGTISNVEMGREAFNTAGKLAYVVQTTVARAIVVADTSNVSVASDTSLSNGGTYNASGLTVGQNGTGSLTVSNGTTANIDGNATVNSGGTVQVLANSTIAIDQTLSSAGLIDIATGGTVSAQTIVSSGDIKNNGTIVSDITVTSGGVLGGSGTIEGDVTIASGGSVGPGNSPGIQTINGDFTFETGSFFDFEVADASGAGAGWDLLDVNGLLTLPQLLTIKISNLGSLVFVAGTTPWEFLRFDSVTGYDPTRFTFDRTGFTYSGDLAVSRSGNSLFVNFTPSDVPTAVPEPGTLGLLATGAVGLVGGWYRKRRKTTLAA